MLALQPPQQGKPLDPKTEEDSSSSSLTCRCTPNILPCRINHDGSLDSTLERYWKPTVDGNGDDASSVKPPTQTAYFRGRKLKGHHVPIPEGYKGILATPTTRTLPNSNPNPPEEGDETDNDDGDEEEEEPTKILEQTSTFDEFVVWSHERAAVASEDPFIKGVEEWIRFAEVMHSNPEESSETSTILASRNKVPDGGSNGS